MGQDGEEAAELVATIRGEHVVMKNWFMGPSPAAEELRKKYGPYPGLWKEVLNWPGWKEARKVYLAEQQKKESGATTGSVPRKRRSRWGTADNSNDDSNKRRSRWGREDSGGNNSNNNNNRSNAGPPAVPPVSLPGLPGMPANLPPQDQEKMRNLQGSLRQVNEKLENLEAEAARVDALPRGHRERSPSPPPVYGVDGKRKNTRAVRWRERYSAERHDILEELMNMNPATKKSNLFKRKRSKKVRIPVELHPTYNFIGLIIGPRGKTQKDLEAKTGCKIAIRGKGSVKEGARGRRDGKMMEGDNEPLHVVITGDDQKSVDAATDMIEQMLVVIDDEKNVHKQQQLRELALLNGTLKQDEFCSICAEKGHSSFECPKRFSMKKQTVAVKCAICGDTSHPTRDCTQKGAAEKANPQELDSDYMSFMAELDGKKVEKAAPAANASAPAKSDANTHTPSGLPPPPSGRTTAPPSGGPPAPPTSLPPPPPAAGLPPPPPSVGSLPPPPAQKPPFVAAAPYGQQPPPAANYYGHQQQQAPPGQPQYYGGQQQQQYPPPQGGQPAYQQQPPYGQPPQQQQQQQAHQPRPGEETAAWDPSSYYGYGGQGDAGGFQWWS